MRFTTIAFVLAVVLVAGILIGTAGVMQWIFSLGGGIAPGEGPALAGLEELKDGAVPIARDWLEEKIEPEEEKLVFGQANPGEVKAFFCPEMDCQGELVSFLDGARESIDCALYDIGLGRVAEKLLEKKDSGLLVRIVIDDKQAEDNTVVDILNQYYLVRTDKRKGDYMHNKFCVVDNARVLVGSMNATPRGVEKNNNNFLIIENEYVVGEFAREFKELWTRHFNTGEQAEQKPDTGYEVRFCPEDECANTVIRYISEAVESVRCEFFSFTHDEISRAMVEANNKGVNVKVIFEKSQLSTYSEKGKLAEEGVSIIVDGNPYNMHNKFCVFDGNIVMTGSFNASKHADEANDESIVFVHSQKIAGLYGEVFSRHWNAWEEEK